MRKAEREAMTAPETVPYPPRDGKGRADFLARGELDDHNVRNLAELKAQIRREAGLSCHDYKESYLRRRLAVRLRARNVHDYGDYARLLREDPTEYVRLVSQFTIHVSRFFRNPPVWGAIHREVVPDLFDREDSTIRVWSAGSANGEEAYSISMLLHEYARANGRMAELDRFTILGTDIDATVLERARQGEYGPAALSDLPADMRDRWFKGGPRFRLDEEVRARVRFANADLFTDRWPGRQHLILCRNVLIYVDRSVQPKLLSSLYDALVPGGYLVLGRVEPLLGPAAARFRTIDNIERIYQRP